MCASSAQRCIGILYKELWPFPVFPLVHLLLVAHFCPGGLGLGLGLTVFHQSGDPWDRLCPSHSTDVLIRIGIALRHLSSFAYLQGKH